jgi:hypothetical protein
MDLDQFSARCLESIQVGVGRIQCLPHLGGREFHIGIEVHAAKIPVGLLEDHVGEESDAERKLQRSFAGISAIPSDPQRPAAGLASPPGSKPGKTELPAASCRPE